MSPLPSFPRHITVDLLIVFGLAIAIGASTNAIAQFLVG